eukprot:Rhum_TRINITY_DN14923_c5_g1::Rhum_TRINITY_DN14923_c5_g1_i1::g.132169::m.132169
MPVKSPVFASSTLAAPPSPAPPDTFCTCTRLTHLPTLAVLAASSAARRASRWVAFVMVWSNTFARPRFSSWLWKLWSPCTTEARSVAPEFGPPGRTPSMMSVTSRLFSMRSVKALASSYALTRASLSLSDIFSPGRSLLSHMMPVRLTITYTCAGSSSTLMRSPPITASTTAWTLLPRSLPRPSTVSSSHSHVTPDRELPPPYLPRFSVTASISASAMAEVYGDALEAARSLMLARPWRASSTPRLAVLPSFWKSTSPMSRRSCSTNCSLLNLIVLPITALRTNSRASQPHASSGMTPSAFVERPTFGALMELMPILIGSRVLSLSSGLQTSSVSAEATPLTMYIAILRFARVQ